MRIKLFGEEHESTADSYKTLGVTQRVMYDNKAALQSHQRVFAICIKLFGEEPESIADSYTSLGVRQHAVRGTQRQFSENICSEEDLRSRIFGTFVVKFVACLPLLGFSNI